MPKFKGACIQYRQMYHYLGRFTTMYAADNFADARPARSLTGGLFTNLHRITAHVHRPQAVKNLV
jgi:hypothetical protein